MSSADGVATGAAAEAGAEATSLAPATAEADGAAAVGAADSGAVVAVPLVPHAARNAAMPASAPPARTLRRLIGVEVSVSRSTRETSSSCPISPPGPRTGSPVASTTNVWSGDQARTTSSPRLHSSDFDRTFDVLLVDDDPGPARVSTLYCVLTPM